MGAQANDTMPTARREGAQPASVVSPGGSAGAAVARDESLAFGGRYLRHIDAVECRRCWGGSDGRGRHRQAQYTRHDEGTSEDRKKLDSHCYGLFRRTTVIAWPAYLHILRRPCPTPAHVQGAGHGPSEGRRSRPGWRCYTIMAASFHIRYRPVAGRYAAAGKEVGRILPRGPRTSGDREAGSGA